MAPALPMSSPTPVQSLLGGVGLSLPVHALLVLNGSTFGVSGFIHRAVRGDGEAACAVLGLILGGAVVGQVEGVGPQVLSRSLRSAVLSGLLVGIGTKLGNGCTSGHMLCGVSRLSLRSIVATATFCLTGAITTFALHRNSIPPPSSADWSLRNHTITFLALQLAPLVMSVILYISDRDEERETDSSKPMKAKAFSRQLVSLTTAFSFGVALVYSNITMPSKIISFLLLPFHKAFDPSLVYFAIGSLPLSMLLYRYCRGSSDKPLLGGGKCNVNGSNKIDVRLLVGAAVFGVGWGLFGVCPGPGLVNAGRALSTGSDLSRIGAWLGSVVLGGLLI